MRTEQAIRQISATGLLGGWRRRRAINALARLPCPANYLVLATTLNTGHPNAKLIASILKRLTASRDGEIIETIWRAWVENPKPALAIVLKHIGWPQGRQLDINFADSILALITKQPVAPEIIEAIECVAPALPVDNGIVNDSLYKAWAYSQSTILEHSINLRGHQPSNPMLETLYALVTGQLERYKALEDEEANLLTQAVHFAPVVLLERISNTIATSADPQLRYAYRMALSRANLNIIQHFTQLQLIGDEIGLFAQIATLRLGQVLELCERWANNTFDWSAYPSQQATLAQAMPAYLELKTPKQSLNPNLPTGVVNIFDYWHIKQLTSSNIIRSDNPINRARSLYLGNNANIKINNDQWLERLAARITNTTSITKPTNDPVCWVAVGDSEASLLQTPIVGTPITYLQHTALLAQTYTATMPRVAELLKILCAFQKVFVGSDIVIETLREPPERNAIRVEDYY